MLIPITSMFAGSLGLLMFTLAFAVVLRRVKDGHSWGDGAQMTLTRAIRSHGNLIEYAPFFLILLALLELQQAASTWLSILGTVFICARLLYVVYFALKQTLPLRILGFWGSAGPIAAASLWLLILQSPG